MPAGSPRMRTEVFRRQMVRFGVVFGGSLLVFGLSYLWLRTSTCFQPFLDLNAVASSWFLNLLNENTAASGAMVSSPGFCFWVSPECTSTIFTAIFAAAVLAWPSTAKEKLLGITMGTAALLFINLVRIISLFYIGSFFPAFLDLAHFFLWQIAMILFTVALWLLWAEKMVSKPRPEST